MSQGLTILAAVLVLADLAFCFGVGLKTRGGSNTAAEYFIGDKKIGPVLLFLTAWASFSGAGNFIGQAGRGAMEGISAYWLWLGEGFLGGIIMGYILAPYLARFKYLSMPHFISGYLFGGDPQIRRVGGVAALMPNVVVIIFGLKLFNFDFGYLKDQVMAADPGKWDLFVDKPAVIVTSFLTGLVGAVSNPIFWNRAFAAKDVKTARKAYGLTFFMNIIMAFIMILLGIVSLMYTNQGDQALVWLIMNKMPVFCSVILAVSVLAACMSCADTHLNCAAVNIVSDIMDPEGKLGDEKSVRYAKRATLAAGVVAILSGLFGDYIYALGTYGYTVCGGVLPAITATVGGMVIANLFCRDQTWKKI